MIKPGQSGKTRTMQEMIRSYQQLCPEGALNIIICSNNKKLVEQTTARMTDDLFETGSSVSTESDSDDRIEGSCFTWTSGSKKTNNSVGELADVIKEGNVTMVVCCAHKTRLNYLYSLVTNLENSRNFHGRINIWIDEADASINLWSQPQFDATRMAKVEKVTLVSGTFISIMKKYGRIRVLPFKNPHPECYHKIADCVLITDDTPTVGAEYVMDVFSKNALVYSRPGIRLFAPGDRTVASHIAIEEFLHVYGFAVLIVNGPRKEFTFPDGSEAISVAGHIPEGFEDDPDRPPLEIGKIMADIYKTRGLERFPFAVTGQLCIGRGITFQGKDFIFDYGIIPPITNPADACQCAWRMGGNIKDNDNYKRPTLITTTACMAAILEQEAKSVNLPRLVYDMKLHDVGPEEANLAVHKDVKRYEQDKFDSALNDYKHPMSIVLPCSADQVAYFTSVKGERPSRVLEFLQDARPDIHDTIVDYRCTQVTRPGASAQYKKVVTDVVKRTENNEKNSRFKYEDKKENVWEALVDERENRIIISYYHGAATKIPEDSAV